jgi:hypothetical protein
LHNVAPMRSLALGLALLPLALTACPLTSSPAAKAQDIAQTMNLDMRFGRMESAVSAVAEKERDAWTTRHKNWGGAVRIADTEMGGVRIKTLSEAEVIVRVSWYRMDEQELRMTSVKQTFKDVKGEWRLAGEVRVDGDIGLLGEPVAPREPAPETVEGRRASKHFPSIRIGGDDEE